MIRYKHLLAYLILLTFLLPGFSQEEEESITSSFGDQLTIGVIRDFRFDLNPFQIDSPAEKEIKQLIFGYGLTKKPDKIGNPPSLIARYLDGPTRKNTRIWRLLLHRNIIFHNGDNLRNVDVKFTFDLIKKFGGNILNRELNFSNIKQITLNGDLEVTFELYKPDPEFGLKLSDVPIVSHRYYQSAMEEGYQIFQKLTPMGMGPFRYVFSTPEMMLLQYHPHYYGGRPFLDRVKIQFYNDEQSLVDALVNGEVDYVELPDRNTARRIHDLMGRKLYIFLIPRPERKVYTLNFNLHRFPFSEPEVRKAIYLALNREELVKRFLKDIGRVANTLIPDNNPYYEHELFQKEYDPQKALLLLRRKGWRLNKQTGILEKNGRPLSFRLYFTENSFLEENIARTIKLDLGELNINVQPVPVPRREKEELFRRNRFSAMISSYTYDPQYLFKAFKDFYFNFLGAGHNSPNYTNRYLTRLFNLTISRPEKHQNLYQRFQVFVKQDLPIIFLFFDERIIIGLDNRFHQFRTSFTENSRFFYRMNPIENWFVPKEKQIHK